MLCTFWTLYKSGRDKRCEKLGAAGQQQETASPLSRLIGCFAGVTIQEVGVSANYMTDKTTNYQANG